MVSLLRFRSRLAIAALGAGLLAAGCDVVATPTQEPSAPEATATPVTKQGDDIIAPAATSDRIIVREVGKKDAVTVGVVGEPFVLDGARSVDDGVIDSATWTQVSGPSDALISDTGSAAPSVVPTTAGTYVFELTVTDNTGLTSTNQVELQVDDPPSSTRGNIGPIRWMAPEAIAFGGTLPIRFALIDSTADLASLEVQFSVDGGSTWSPATKARPEATTVGSLVAPEVGDEVVVSRTPVPDAGALERQERLAPTPTLDSTLKAAPASGSLGGMRIHTFLWDAQADLGKQATAVEVRGWDPVKKEAIRGGGVNHYDPLILDMGRSCKLHPDVWLLSVEMTPVRNAALDRCAGLVLGQLEASGAISAAQSKEIMDGLTGYSDEVRRTIVLPHLLEQSGGTKAIEDLLVAQQDSLRKMDLQSVLQKQAQLMQTLSNILKTKHDTLKSIINNVRA